MIDLHTHTTASDGRSTPVDLVERAAAEQVDVLSVTDHDTVAACGQAAAACTARGIEFVPGIEITAIQDDTDVHVLGYFIDPEAPALTGFLAAQRRVRRDRVRQIIERLATLGIVLDADAILQPSVADPAKAPGRPWVARALVAAGHVATPAEAFDRWLERGRPGFVPRLGAPPAEVIARIHDSGGLASLAHPGLLQHDEWLTGFAASGLDALEAYYVDHDAPTTERYLAAADRLGLLVTGGTDYHGDPAHGAPAPGRVFLPRGAYDRLKARCERFRATRRASASTSS